METNKIEEKIKRMYEQQEIYCLIEEIEQKEILKKLKLYCQKQGYHLKSENILSSYEILYNTPFKKYFDELLKKRNFRFSPTIRESISYLLSNKKELIYHYKPELFPGIIKIEKQKDYFYLYTPLGTIHVKKASEVFKSTPSYKIFSKTLGNYCYQRSDEFIKENKEYQIVFSWMPNPFTEDITMFI